MDVRSSFLPFTLFAVPEINPRPPASRTRTLTSPSTCLIRSDKHRTFKAQDSTTTLLPICRSIERMSIRYFLLCLIMRGKDDF